jgi:dihydroorotase/N-acyl-D-amino-acid deacylase
MVFVLVNGVPVIDQEKITGALPGKVLRGPGYGPCSAATEEERTIEQH